MRGAVLAPPDTADEPVRIPGARRPSPPGTPRRTRADRAPYLLALALFAAYATLSVLRHHRMETRSWDLGIFEQAVRGYAHLQAPVADLKGPGANILGDHFSPVTALLAPAYRLFPTPVTLLVAQAALFALAAIPVTRVATGCSAGPPVWRSVSPSDCPGAFSRRSTSTSTRSASPYR